MPLTVSDMARACGLSRAAILYYESAGLLNPARRTPSNYRIYTGKELERLRRIRAYRDAGLTLADIRSLLGEARGDAAAVLQRRLREVSKEIERLRGHQRDIARLLKQTSQLRRMPMITKEKWISVMSGAGFTEEDMSRWHAEFEKSAPQEHQEFLEFLHIPAEEIVKIREWSRK